MQRAIGVTLALSLVPLVAACGTVGDPGPGRSAGSSGSSPRSVGAPSGFPTARFGDVGGGPVPNEVAAAFQRALREMSDRSGGAGMSATVISPDGTWTGTTGKASPTRPVRADDQFAIGSVTKSVVAAQVMRLVEAGELELDDPVAVHVPTRLDFDTNGATIRHLLGHRSGIPDYDPIMLKMSESDPMRRWDAEQLLRLVPKGRTPAGRGFDYSSTNYLLLGLVIERLTGQPLSAVLRAGVLSSIGATRLIYQPDEAPTEPVAMPWGRAAVSVEKGGGFLPSLANATGGGPASAMASDSPSLARWWQALCAGEIVSQESLNQMTTWKDDYGLGLFDVAEPYADSVGHVGWDVGYASWAGCLPEDGTVVVVLANRVVDDLGGMAHPLLMATLAE